MNIKNKIIGLKTQLGLLLIVFAVVLSNQLVADVRLPNIFGNNMVLQREKEINIWGWADAGENITISFNNFNQDIKANEAGEWKTKLPSMKAGGPFNMTIKGKNTIELKNILIGEVWVCSGQSNMEMGISKGYPSSWNNGVLNYEKEVQEANYPEIRFFLIPRKTSGIPVNDVTAKWDVCDTNTIKTFSAAAYFFGRKLYKELNVPIGLINSSWGGSAIEPWTAPQGFAMEPELKDFSTQIGDADKAYINDIKPALKYMDEWIKGSYKAIEDNKPLPVYPNMPKHALESYYQPTGIYNAMIYPIIPYTIRGAIWYQGETNCMNNDGIKYYTKMKALINGWRKLWQEGDFPFYYVQLAPWNYGEDTLLLPKFWEVQTTCLSIPNTGMAITTDLVDDINNIHPINKQDVGLRLALWALAKTYNKDKIVYSGPIFKDMSIEGDKIKINFNYTGSGLSSKNGEALSWFYIAGSDSSFVKAQTKIEGNSVIVWNDNIKTPVAVRFGWSQTAMPNLINKEGLPASPFRTDKW